MLRAELMVVIDTEVLARLDRMIGEGHEADRSAAVEAALREKLDRIEGAGRTRDRARVSYAFADAAVVADAFDAVDIF